MSELYTTKMVEKYAISFAVWILENGFQPSNDHPHKWMKFHKNGFKTYTESQMLKEYKKTNIEESCDHDYQPDCACGKDIVVCKKCGDVI